MYDMANLKVARLCNHQKISNNTNTAGTEKVKQKIKELKSKLNKLKRKKEEQTSNNQKTTSTNKKIESIASENTVRFSEGFSLDSFILSCMVPKKPTHPYRISQMNKDHKNYSKLKNEHWNPSSYDLSPIHRLLVICDYLVISTRKVIPVEGRKFGISRWISSCKFSIRR
jgi:hypothetical protein